MKKSFLIILFTVLTGAARADDIPDQHFTPKKWEVGLHAGFSLPAGRSNELLSESPHYQATFERHISTKNAVGFEFGASPGHPQDGVIVIDIDGDGKNESIPVEADEKVSMFFTGLFYRRGKVDDYGTRGTRWVRKYIHIGVGYYQTHVDSGLYRLKGTASSGLDLNELTHPFDNDTDRNFGFNLGVGFGTLIFDSIRIGLDARYHRMIKHDRDAEFFTPTVRLSYFFGRN